MKTVRQRVDAIKLKLTNLYDELIDLQTICPHPTDAVFKRPESDTGNYDPSQDRYWTDFTCSHCDKRWTEEGSK